MIILKRNKNNKYTPTETNTNGEEKNVIKKDKFHAK